MHIRAFPLSIALTLLGVAGLLAAIAYQPAADAQGAEFELRFATVAPDGTPWAKQLNGDADASDPAKRKGIKGRVEDESGGRIKFKLFMGSQLGGEKETLRKCRRGDEVQGWGGSTAAIADALELPEFQVFELPYMFDGDAEADYVMDAMFDKMAAQLETKGMVLAYWHVNGWHNYATKETPIHTPADMQGMKMRTQESNVHRKTFEALGAQPQTIPVPEVLSALSTGMVDGFSNTPLFTAATGWYEQIGTYTLTNHIYQPAAIVYNKAFYDKLVAETVSDGRTLADVLIGDRAYETTYGRKSVRDTEAFWIEMFADEGIDVVTLTPEERAAFKQATASVHDAMSDEIGASFIAAAKSARSMYRKAN